MLSKLRSWLRENFEAGASPNGRDDGRAIHHACCLLLMEVARLETSNTARKHALVADVMRETFALPETELAAMIDTFSRPENRLTSYFEPVQLVNAHLPAARRVHFVEQLWRVAMVDGDIDMYEDHLVRKLSDLLYVPHREFILAKNRVQARPETP